MATELAKTYEPRAIEARVTERWLSSGAFAAVPDGRPPERRYVIMMPLPNVTGALHMGHAMDNVMQDLLVRWHRMRGDNTLWQPGTDHAGIATQAVVEKRLFELEGKTRHDIGREELVRRIWAWKDEYQQRIVRQQQQMGCSADWQRQRFTMDEVCSAAVREAFFRLFCDRLIYRGDRLVNWDCQLQTAVADDEVYHEPVAGHFWHLRYPLKDPGPGEPTHVVVATTRPETMLGDTAVACHPDPRAALAASIAAQRDKISAAGAKERAAEEEELARLEARAREQVTGLEQLAALARAGKRVILPLLEREIPLIVDPWAKPELGSGCVKITPAHDPNDYAVWQRHRDQLGILNILNPDGTLNRNAGPYAGLDRFAARERVVADLQARGLIEAIEEREIEIGHSDRSKTPVEPYLSKQWFVRMGDLPGGVTCGRGTAKERHTTGLAQAAIDAVRADWRSPGGLRLSFHPERYAAGYVAWLAEKRDWCISRQLWWGHRIPVWTRVCTGGGEVRAAVDAVPRDAGGALHLWVSDADGQQLTADAVPTDADGSFEVQVCVRSKAAEAAHAAALAAAGFAQDPDVLDTWFSSALWPFSTLGWPNPAAAAVNPGQTRLGGDGGPDSFSYYYPGSCLVTARDIITLWVARMIIMGLYNHGELPFTDCFVHAKILDGKGVTMSKSKGNGIDPAEIIRQYGADAMRYLICDMETGMQDVRLPVQATCPTCQAKVELTDAEHGHTIFTYLCTACHAEFDVLGTMPNVPAASVTSDRFEVGRAFCNKLWNAARFALSNLGQLGFSPLDRSALAAEDRWILSRLQRAISAVDEHLGAYRPAAAVGVARDFFWGELCDWYLELIKPRMRDDSQAPIARQVLAHVLDQVLRLLHPFVPFITEALWEFLREQAPVRGLATPLGDAPLCLHAPWPTVDPGLIDAPLEQELARVQEVIGRLRELRARHDVPPRRELPAAIRGPAERLAVFSRHAGLIRDQARLSALHLGSEAPPLHHAATQVSADLEILLGDVLDPVVERKRLGAVLEKLHKQLEASQKKLANPSFVERAPADVVAGEKTKVAELSAQIASLTTNLAALEG